MKEDHPVYKINKAKIMLKGTLFAMVIVLTTVSIAVIILYLKNA